MKKKIEKIIIDDVKNTLAEYDIEGMVERAVNKTRTQREVLKLIDNKIYEEVTNMIHSAIFKAIRKHQPLIDASIENNVRGFMYGFDEYLKSKSHDKDKGNKNK